MMQKLVKMKRKYNHNNHNKHIANQEFNKLTLGNVDARLKQASLGSENHIADFVKIQHQVLMIS